MLTVEPFRTADIAPFMKLAAMENWVADNWEFEFLLAEFPQGCFVARSADGETQGFVTSLLHKKSGWIGNLVVAESYRGRGIGESLFLRAVEALKVAGALTIWLTASESGAPLYEKHGFTGIDNIIRWVGHGRGGGTTDDMAEECESLANPAYDLDSNAWGDHRAALLGVTSHRGMTIQQGPNFIVRQQCGAAVQFGPFAAADYGSARYLFTNAANSVPSGVKILVDAPTSNRSAFKLYKHYKMRISGSSLLMYAGIKSEYRPELLYGLATFGSCG